MGKAGLSDALRCTLCHAWQENIGGDGLKTGMESQ